MSAAPLLFTEGEAPSAQIIPLRRPYTQVDNAAFDEAMAELSGAAWKCLCYLVRRTTGYRQEEVRVSLAQICSGRTNQDGVQYEKGTGLSRKAVTLALHELHVVGIITSDAATVSQTSVRTYRLMPQESWNFSPCNSTTRVKKTRVHDANKTRVQTTRDDATTRVKKTLDGVKTRVKTTPLVKKEDQRKEEKENGAASPAPPAPSPRHGAVSHSHEATGSTAPPGHLDAPSPPSSAPPPAPVTRRPVNPIWDALVAVLGYEPDAKAKSERSNWGGCVKQLKDLEATPTQIVARGTAWARRYPGATFTVNALVKHWSELGAEVARPSNGHKPPGPSGGRSFREVLADRQATMD